MQLNLNNLLNGNPTITGTPTFQNGICFPSGCQTSVPSGTSNTFNSSTTFNSSVQISSGPLTLGSTSGPQEFCEITHDYKSADGVSQSSGTAFTLQPVGTGLTAYFVATTTTTQQNNAIINLSTPCNPGSMCTFCVKGNVYVNDITNGCNATQSTVNLSNNSRGNLTAETATTFGQIGWCLSASSAGAAAWIRLGM
jgi:hypothetical protein